MEDSIIAEANRLKQKAGQRLENQLYYKFNELVGEGIIESFSKKKNFPHIGFKYKKQYLANFILETLDNKFIVINSSSSYRHDRYKLQSYDLEGVINNADFSDKIIASVFLYPDSERKNSSLSHIRKLVSEKTAYSPASHILVFSELVAFLETHKSEVLEKKESEKRERANFKNQTSQSGSYYGTLGNQFEKIVVEDLNNLILLEDKAKGKQSTSLIFDKIINEICTDYNINPAKLTHVRATNVVKKLKGGGNAKTDLILELTTASRKILETISIKNTTLSSVSCHDYRVDDFIRVLAIEGTKLDKYLRLWQESGNDKDFSSNLSGGESKQEFEFLLKPYSTKLVEWALTGRHDTHNLIDPKKQISNYILINKNGKIKFSTFSKYINELNNSKNKRVYGVPLRWTYPSKQKGRRIQLKMPIIIND